MTQHENTNFSFVLFDDEEAAVLKSEKVLLWIESVHQRERELWNLLQIDHLCFYDQMRFDLPDIVVDRKSLGSGKYWDRCETHVG